MKVGFNFNQFIFLRSISIRLLLILKKYYPLVAISAIILSNLVLATALPIQTTSSLPLFSDTEGITLSRQAIAFGFGAFTQFWACVLFDKTYPVRNFAAKVVLAGLAAGVVIGILRGVVGVSWQIGGESGVASVIGWLGVESGFALAQKLIGTKVPQFNPSDKKEEDK